MSNYSQKQSGAVEACWAHNPEVRRSKLRSARNILCQHDPLAQRIARWTSNPKVAGSSPAKSRLTPVAHLVERWSYEPEVAGSSPAGSNPF